VTPGPHADRVLLAHMQECLARIHEYTGVERARFDGSRLVQDAVIRNLQTLAESSQRLSSEIKAGEPHIPWRDLGGFRNVIVHGYLGVDLQAVWLVVEQDLPALAEAVHRMAKRLTPASAHGAAPMMQLCLTSNYRVAARRRRAIMPMPPGSANIMAQASGFATAAVKLSAVMRGRPSQKRRSPRSPVPFRTPPNR